MDVLYAFYIFFGTNLLTQCQVPVPVFFHVFDPFQRRFWNEVQTEENPRNDFFTERKKIGKLGSQGRGASGAPQAPTLRPGGRPRPTGLWSPWAPSALGVAPIYSLKIPKKSGDHRNYFSATASFCLRKIPSGARFGALSEGGFGHGGLLHQHHYLSDDA